MIYFVELCGIAMTQNTQSKTQKTQSEPQKNTTVKHIIEHQLEIKVKWDQFNVDYIAENELSKMILGCAVEVHKQEGCYRN